MIPTSHWSSGAVWQWPLLADLLLQVGVLNKTDRFLCSSNYNTRWLWGRVTVAIASRSIASGRSNKYDRQMSLRFKIHASDCSKIMCRGKKANASRYNV